MMDGITVLNEITNPIMEFQWTTGCTIALVIGIIFIVFVFILCCIDQSPEAICVFLVGLFIVAVIEAVAIFQLGSNTQIGTYQSYEVLIDDNVSMTEFYDKYEVIDQHGRIYEIKERVDTD